MAMGSSDNLSQQFKMDSSLLRQNSSPAGLLYNLNHPNGASVMGINPENGKFCSHLDYWDSIKNNEHFSTEGLVDLIKQLQIYKTPDLETSKYQMLKRMATYEDYWDSIKNNEHLSTEGLVDLIKQLQIYKTPDLETAKYQMLKKFGNL